MRVTSSQVFAEISLRSGNCTNPAQLRQFVPQPVVVGLFRDLRGIATATSTRRTYTLLFDWMVSFQCPCYSHDSCGVGATLCGFRVHVHLPFLNYIFTVYALIHCMMSSSWHTARRR